MSDTQPATTYPTAQLYDQWTEAADANDMSTSEWMEAMIEAGRKKFSIADVEPDEEKTEIRRERAHYAQQLNQTITRLETLQQQLDHTERAAIKASGRCDCNSAINSDKSGNRNEPRGWGTKTREPSEVISCDFGDPIVVWTVVTGCEATSGDECCSPVGCKDARGPPVHGSTRIAG